MKKTKAATFVAALLFILYYYYAGNVAPVGNTLKFKIINSAVLVG
jgi:hypothetical protein